MQFAASLESKSAHPLAGAIVSEFVGCLAEQGDRLLPVQKLVVVPGVGLEGWIAIDKEEDDWRHCAVGNEKLFRQNGGKCILAPTTVQIVEEFCLRYENTGASILFVSVDDRLRLLLAMADTLRPEAVEFILELRKLGMSRILMFTGDQVATAHYIARKVGLNIEDVRARLTPSEKLELIRAAKVSTDTKVKHKILMIGDGINDAAALAGAHVGGNNLVAENIIICIWCSFFAE